MLVFVVVPGYDLRRMIVRAQAMTGQSNGSPVAECITVSFCSSFFCTSNVIATDVADNKFCAKYDISLLLM